MTWVYSFVDEAIYTTFAPGTVLDGGAVTGVMQGPTFGGPATFEVADWDPATRTITWQTASPFSPALGTYIITDLVGVTPRLVPQQHTFT